MDRIFEAYNGAMGAEFMHKTRERLHWICSQVWGSRVLDVGCSQGVVPIILARMGYAVDGLDINPEAIAFANEQLAKEPQDIQSKVTYTVADFGKFVPPQGRTYDVITMTEVLEHLVRPQDFIRKAFSILPEQGRLIVTVPFGINDDPDHRQTFYLTSIYSLLHPLFEIGGVKIFGPWIGLSCRRRAVETKDPPVIPLALMRQAEEAFFKIERPLRDGTLAVKNQRQALKAEQGKLAEDLRAAEKARLEAEARVAAADTTPLRSELADVRGQLSVSEGEKQSLQTSLEVERKVSAGLQDQVSMLKAMLQFATSRQQDNSQETRLLEYSQEVRDLRTALDQKRDEAISRAEEFGRLAGRVEYLQSSNRQLAAECEALEKQVAQQESAAASAKEAAASEQAQREKLSEEMSEAGKRLESQAARIEELEAELDRRRSWTEQHKRESKDVRMRLFSVQNELAEKTRALSDAESRYEAESKAHQESLAKIDELGQRLETNVAQSAVQSEQDAVRIKELEDALAGERSWEEQHKRECAAVQDRLSAVEKDLVEKSKALVEAEAKSANEEKLHRKFSAEAYNLGKQVASWAAQAEAQAVRINALESELVAKSKTLTEAESKCASEEKAHRKFSSEAFRLGNEKTALEQKIRALVLERNGLRVSLKKSDAAYRKLSKAKLGRLTLRYWRWKDGFKRAMRLRTEAVDSRPAKQSLPQSDEAAWKAQRENEARFFGKS